MTVNRLCLLVGIMLMLSVLTGCMAKEVDDDRTRISIDSMTEEILTAMNEDDYGKFSKNFNPKMKGSLPEPSFKVINDEIKRKIGHYLSKERMSIDEKDQSRIVIYKARFSQEAKDVIIRIIFSEENQNIYVSGFWLDSPNLRK